MIGEYRLFIEIFLIMLLNYGQSVILFLFSYQMTYDKIERGSLPHEAFEKSKSCYFTTGDKDRDSHGDLNSGNDNRGGWWYSDCGWMHLNGLWEKIRIPSCSPWDKRYIGMRVYNGNFTRWVTYTDMRIRLWP